MEEKAWIKPVKETMRAIMETMDALAEIRDAIEEWGMTQKQADRLCVAMLEAALKKTNKGNDVWQ